jgi:hypothetical protein
MTGIPSAEVGPNGFPTVQMINGIPAALGMPNPDVEAALALQKEGKPLPTASRPGTDVFQREWLAACKGQNAHVAHGTSSKTHCDFEYSGTMMEQMLLGLVAHRAGKKLEYDPKTGRVTNMPEANDYLKREYRSGWKLDG